MGHRKPILLAIAACVGITAPLSAQSGPASSQPESVSISRAAHGLTVDDGRLIGGGGDYKVVFDQGGALFVPALGEAVASNQRLRLTLDTIHRGDATIAAADGTAQPDLSLVDQSIAQYRHGGIVERYEVRADALKQSFVFAEQPAGEGDLVVRLRVETNMTAQAGESLQGLKMFAGALEAVHIGAVVGVDAAGRRIAGHMNYSGSHLELVLPDQFVSTASYPLVLDPPICCGQILASSSKQNHRPDIAYEPVSDRYLVVWEHVFSATDQDIRGHFVSGDGLPIGNLLIIDQELSREEDPTVCAVAMSGEFVVAYEYTAVAGPNQFVTSDILGRTVDAASGALGPRAFLTTNFNNDLNPSLGGDSTGQDNECVLVYETENSNVIESREITVSTNGALTEVTSRRRTVGFATTTPGVDATPEISKDAGAGAAFAITWIGDDQESQLCFRLMGRNSNMLSAMGCITGGSRMRNPEVSGTGQSFVVVCERAASSGAKQDIWGLRLAIPASTTAAPLGFSYVPLATDNAIDHTDPAVGLDGDRVLVGISRERAAPRGPYTMSGEFSAATMSQCGSWFGLGSIAQNSYNLETAIALRVPGSGTALDGLTVFRQDINIGGSLLVSSDIRVWRHVATVALASTTPSASCPAAPHAFGGPVIGFGGTTPRIGTTLSITGSLLAGTPLCRLLIGAPAPLTPLAAFGSTVPGSAICVSALASVASSASTPFGTATFPLAIPNDSTFCGLQLDAQWIDYEGTGLNFGSSQSVRLTIGL